MDRKQIVLDRLQDLQRRAVEGGGTKRVERQHAKGKLTARERVDALLDPGSFEEFDQLKTHCCPTSGWRRVVSPVTGW